MKTPHMIFGKALPIILVLISGVGASGVSAQTIDHQAGLMQYHPFPMDQRDLAGQAWNKLTPSFLRQLSDSDPLLYQLYHNRIQMEEVPQAGQLVPDMVEMDMWRRGDVTVQMVKKLFTEPPNETTQYTISIWLRYRPWMKPDEFVPLARQIYAAHNLQRKTNNKSQLTLGAMVELLARWGEPQDEETVAKYVKEQLAKNQSPSMHKMWLVHFKQRQALREQGDPRGMPPWFYDKREGIKSAVPTPLKTYNEAKLNISSNKELGQPSSQPVAPAQMIEEEADAHPPWLILGGAVLTLLALLTLQRQVAKRR